MNRNMVLAEWSRAREALRAAETLTRDRCYADAISSELTAEIARMLGGVKVTEQAMRHAEEMVKGK